MPRHVEPKKVRRELLPDQSPGLLKALHLLTRDGHLNADALRKLKQVNHLVGLLNPALEDAFGQRPDPAVVDVGSGNAYLGFVLYELFFARREQGELWCIEGRPELTAQAQARAQGLGFARMRFQTAQLHDAAYPQPMALLTALHACDTATDDALFAAISGQAAHVAVVPCCQAEVAAQLKVHKDRVEPALAALFSHPWHRREFGSHLTNVIRALVLESAGYAVTVTELTGWEHSLKNELILGRKVQPENPRARRALDALLAATGVAPKLVVRLGWAPAPD